MAASKFTALQKGTLCRVLIKDLRPLKEDLRTLHKELTLMVRSII